MIEVGITLACPPQLPDDQRVLTEEMGISAFHHQFPDAAYTGVDWVWCEAFSWEGDDGTKHETPAHWALYVMGEQP